MNSSSGTSKRPCEYVKADGQPCQANAMISSNLCFFHDPSRTQERAAARKAGGIERTRHAIVLPSDTPDVELMSATQLARLLAETINQVRRGQLDPKVAYAVGQLVFLLMKAHDAIRLEGRLEEQEAAFRAETISNQRH